MSLTSGGRIGHVAQLSINAWIFSTTLGLRSSFIHACKKGLTSSSALRFSGGYEVDASALGKSLRATINVSFSFLRSNPSHLLTIGWIRGMFVVLFPGPPVAIPLCVMIFTLGSFSRSSTLTLCTFCVGVGCFSYIFAIKMGQSWITGSNCLQYRLDYLVGFGHSLMKCPTSLQL